MTSQADAQIPRKPAHIALIMDGNGRWANERGMPRTEGHRAGIKSLRKTVEQCLLHDIRYLTVFSFSSENWTRPKDEITFIFKLLRRFVASDLERLIRNNVRVKIAGERSGLDDDLLKLINQVETQTASGDAMTLIVAFNYGSKAELATAARRIALAVRSGDLDPAKITEQTVADNLYLPEAPDPDLIIRTGGEQRLSNFLLWQAAYAELVFIDTYWPDFDEKAFEQALVEFSGRERRFGAVKAVVR